MDVPCKRLRTKSIITNAVPSENQSLLLEMLGNGSGDNLMKIFQYVTSPKDKVNLERACRRFRQMAQTFEAWSSMETFTVVGPDENWHYKLNNDLIPAIFVPSAVHSILSRSRNLKKIDLLSCRCNSTFWSVRDAIIKEGGAITYRYLQQLSLDARWQPDIAYDIVTLVNMFKNQVTALRLMRICFADPDEILSMWRTIGKCRNLKLLSYSEQDNWTYPRIVKRALCGKPIQHLDLQIEDVEAFDLAEIVSLLAGQSPRSLRCTNYGLFSLTDFYERFPAEHWSRLQSFEYDHCRGDLIITGPIWSIILRLPRLCPQLKKLSIQVSTENTASQFQVVVIVDLLMQYLAILNEGGVVVRSLAFTYNRLWLGDTAERVFGSLAFAHKCNVVHFGANDVRILCNRLGQSSIQFFQ